MDAVKPTSHHDLTHFPFAFQLLCSFSTREHRKKNAWIELQKQKNGRKAWEKFFYCDEKLPQKNFIMKAFLWVERGMAERKKPF